MSTARTSNDAKKAGGYLKEKFTIGISRVTGDEVSRSIMKTTSHMLKAPKDKHLQRLLSATHGHCSADSLEKHKDMAAYIVEELEKRSHTHNWIVVLKTMITSHHMLIDGSLSTTSDQKKPAADLDDWFAPAPAPATSTTRETKNAPADIDDIFGPPSSSSAHSAPQQQQYQHNQQQHSGYRGTGSP